ncbi:MAG: response regulator transcription factor [Lachnospiraceae bacterium]|nr:response regulator transcription factor [Lachnospiraceae bacterium]
MFQIMVLEDDNDLRTLFSKALKNNGYNTFEAKDTMEAYDIIEKEYIDLIISDVMLPGEDGFTFIKKLRMTDKDIPVMVITAKGSITDKEIGFKSGADDYMVKPIDINELVFRVEALLRRVKSAHEQKLVFGSTIVEYSSWTVTDDNGSQILPQKEFLLLYKLLSFPGRIFTRQQILDDIWGIDDYVDGHTLDVHISRLRDRFKNNKDFKIMTIRGLGYRVVKNEE